MVSEKALTHMEAANKAYNSSNLLKALKEYNAAIELEPNFDEAWYNKALTLQGIGRYDEALDAYNTALEMDPENSAFYQNMGSIWASKGDVDKAREFYEKAASLAKDLSPRDAATNYYNMGVTYINSGSNEEAKAALEQAIQIDPTHGESHYQLGVVLLGMGDLEGAINIWKKYLEVSPDGPNAPTAEELIKSLSEG